MSTGYIGADLRRRVVMRAERLCEYCLIHEDDTFYGCEVDHIISEKYGGQTHEDNLAYACPFCNRNKGSDIASLDPWTGDLVRLFNPRLDRWAEHGPPHGPARDSIAAHALPSRGQVANRRPSGPGRAACDVGLVLGLGRGSAAHF